MDSRVLQSSPEFPKFNFLAGVTPLFNYLVYYCIILSFISSNIRGVEGVVCSTKVASIQSRHPLFASTCLWPSEIHQKFTMGCRKLRNVACIQNLDAHCSKTIGNKSSPSETADALQFMGNNTLTTLPRHLLVLENDAFGDNGSLTGSEEMLDLDDECVEGNERSSACVEFAEVMQQKFMEWSTC